MQSCVSDMNLLIGVIYEVTRVQKSVSFSTILTSPNQRPLDF